MTLNRTGARLEAGEVLVCRGTDPAVFELGWSTLANGELLTGAVAHQVRALADVLDGGAEVGIPAVDAPGVLCVGGAGAGEVLASRADLAVALPPASLRGPGYTHATRDRSPEVQSECSDSSSPASDRRSPCCSRSR